MIPSEPRPWLANLSLTENCQARCKTCDYWRTNVTQSIDTARAKLLLRELAELGIDSIRLKGGEPLLRRDMFELLDACEPRWFNRVVLATNGLLLGRFAAAINRSIITHLTVSVDGMRTVNDRIRGVRGYFDQVMGSLPEIDRPIKIVSTFTKELVPDLEEMILFCKERGYAYDVNLLDRNLYYFSSPTTRTSIDELWPDAQDIERGLAILRKYDILPEYILSNASQYLNTRTFRFKHCIHGLVEVNIDSKGGVRTGCNVFEPVGNILEQDLASILATAGYARSVNKMVRMDCPGCTCGYGASAIYDKPWKTVGYALRRLV